MRMVWTVVLLVCAAAFPAAAEAAASTPASCPNVLLIESTNGHYYIAVFESKAPTKVAFDLTLYANTATYATTLGGVAITKPLTLGATNGFRSAPAVLKNPGDGELLGASVSPHGPCPAENVLIPSVASLTAPGRLVDPAADALEGQLETEASTNTAVVNLAPSTVPVPACPDAFAPASIDHTVKPVFPPTVTVDATTPPVSVRVSVDATGAVVGAHVETSSGNPAIDAAFLDAAKTSTYHPARFACQSQASSVVTRLEIAK